MVGEKVEAAKRNAAPSIPPFILKGDSRRRQGAPARRYVIVERCYQRSRRPDHMDNEAR